mmetsp:Transcript_103669/g.299876  ORF Transcript_103669/g.299876 Transcript_103669/m.299876 type:complete len:201 (+) Transcript_103669:779-1381(+)
MGRQASPVLVARGRRRSPWRPQAGAADRAASASTVSATATAAAAVATLLRRPVPAIPRKSPAFFQSHSLSLLRSLRTSMRTPRTPRSWRQRRWRRHRKLDTAFGPLSPCLQRNLRLVVSSASMETPRSCRQDRQLRLRVDLGMPPLGHRCRRRIGRRRCRSWPRPLAGLTARRETIHSKTGRLVGGSAMSSMPCSGALRS